MMEKLRPKSVYSVVQSGFKPVDMWITGFLCKSEKFHYIMLGLSVVLFRVTRIDYCVSFIFPETTNSDRYVTRILTTSFEGLYRLWEVLSHFSVRQCKSAHCKQHCLQCGYGGAVRRQFRIRHIDYFLTFQACYRTKCVTLMIALKMIWKKKASRVWHVCGTCNLTSMPLTLNEQRATCNTCLGAERQQFQYLQICTLQGFYVAQIGSFFLRRFGTRSTAGPLKMGPLGCPETAVRKYRSTLCKMPKERISHLHRDGILKSCTVSAPSLNTVNKTPKLTAIHWNKGRKTNPGNSKSADRCCACCQAKRSEYRAMCDVRQLHFFGTCMSHSNRK
jgi:hypothetical protein